MLANIFIWNNLVSRYLDMCILKSHDGIFPCLASLPVVAVVVLNREYIYNWKIVIDAPPEILVLYHKEGKQHIEYNKNYAHNGPKNYC